MTVHTKDRQRVWIDGDGRVRHDIGRDELSNDLAGWLARDLVDPGLLDPAAFEETFVAVVQEIDPGWTAFYRNTSSPSPPARVPEAQHPAGPTPAWPRCTTAPPRWPSGLTLSSSAAASASSPCAWPPPATG
jgi:hypothetical protein